jgi:hypothetical protein
MLFGFPKFNIGAAYQQARTIVLLPRAGKLSFSIDVVMINSRFGHQELKQLSQACSYWILHFLHRAVP